MKRITIVFVVLLLLTGCGDTEKVTPQVQMDARASATAEAVTPTAASSAIEMAAATEAPAQPVQAPVSAGGFEERGMVEELVAAWTAEGLLKDMFSYASEDALDFFGIDFSLCRSAVAFGDAVGYVNEAIILEADETVLDDAEALLREHLDAVRAQFRGYDPQALALAEKAVFLREDNLLLFIIAPQAEEMLTVYRGLTT